MDSPPNLDTLPAETFLQTISHINKEDILALRLACKRVYGFIDKTFVSTFFKERIHLYNTHGLDTLARIATQPRLLAKLEKITFVLQQPIERELSMAKRRSYSMTHLPEDEFLSVKYKIPGKTAIEAEERRKAKLALEDQQRQAAWDRWEAQMTALRENGRDVTLMAQFFAAVEKVRKNLVGLKVCVADWIWGPDKEIYGIATVEKSLPPFRHTSDSRSSKFEHTNPDASTSSIISAIARSASCIDELSIGSLQDEFGPGGLYIHESVFDNAVEVFRNLTTLDIRFGYAFGASRDQWEQGEEECFVGLMNAVTNLKSLRVHGYSTDEGEDDGCAIFRLFGDSLRATSLSKIEISSFHARAEDIVAFLARFRETLKDLHMSFVTLPCDQLWTGVFRSIVHCSKLNVLHLSYLYSHDDRIVGVDERQGLRTRFDLEGEEDVAEGVNFLLRNGQYYDSD